MEDVNIKSNELDRVIKNGIKLEKLYCFFLNEKQKNKCIKDEISRTAYINFNIPYEDILNEICGIIERHYNKD
jgi:hypothetical protein